MATLSLQYRRSAVSYSTQFSNMKKIFHMRSKSKLKSNCTEAHIYEHSPQWRGSRIAAQLPARILAIIFSYVCPHVRDESYMTLEESMTENACMLCDMRDLACCAVVNVSWAKVAQRLLLVPEGLLLPRPQANGYSVGIIAFALIQSITVSEKLCLQQSESEGRSSTATETPKTLRRRD